MVIGFYLSLDPLSALSVSMVLSHAVLPKEAYLQGRGVDLPWPVSGLPERLHLDNAKEFRSQALTRGAAQYGIELQYRPPNFDALPARAPLLSMEGRRRAEALG
jgi:putative transposase